MLKSMTGYGRVKVENELREITVELRSVNHRYLDLNIKVPRIYGYLDDVVSKQAQASIARGKVDIFVSVRAKEGADINGYFVSGVVSTAGNESNVYRVRKGGNIYALKLYKHSFTVSERKMEALKNIGCPYVASLVDYGYFKGKSKDNKG